MHLHVTVNTRIREPCRALIEACRGVSLVIAVLKQPRLAISAVELLLVLLLCSSDLDSYVTRRRVALVVIAVLQKQEQTQAAITVTIFVS